MSELEENEIDDTEKKTDAKNENVVGVKKKKKIFCKEKKWNCDDKPLWRVFMNSYLEEENKLEEEDKFDRRKASLLPRFPNVKSSEEIPPSGTYPCFPLNTFNLKDRARLPNKLNPREKIRIWRNMKIDPEVDTSSFLPKVLPKMSQTVSEKWPAVWPCVKRDLAGELKKLEKLRKRKKKGLLLCREDSEDESNPDDDYAARKELGHARVPIACPNLTKSQLVDRAVGEHPGLVDGDYVLFVFHSQDNHSGNRSYANVCLRGLKGMHLGELSSRRVREKTWKFCFYQAIVALLAKTQLRYKFAWNLNIDYIFDHAWMLFVHMGSMNIKEKIRLDDIIVYNYNYSIELELVHEIKDTPWITGICWNYVEDDLKKIDELERPELMKSTEQIGWEKPFFSEPPPVHEATREIEEWFDKLPQIYRNCIFRTSKFSLAFWQDGTFWYLYNPYRCDEFGFWSDEGCACIIKFCTRLSLKRHVMILMLRAYSYTKNSPLKLDNRNIINEETNIKDKFAESESEADSIGEEEKSKNSQDSKVLTIQIFQMIYRCVKIHNVKLLQRKPPNPRMERERKKLIDDCGSDPLSLYECCSPDGDVTDFCEDDNNEEVDTMEKPSWLKRFKLTWTRFASPRKKNDQDESDEKKLMRWHQFYVEEPLKVFSLWGEIHPTEKIFAKENRGKQIYAVYVVCAGMTRIQAPEYWSPKTLDAIVMCGDRYYTLSQLQSETLSKNDEFINVSCWDKYLGKHFKIGETLFESDVLPALCGRLYKRDERYLSKTIRDIFLKHHAAILTCESSCLCIFKYCGAYYMMDAHSIGRPLFQYGAGVAYLIRATSFNKFITVIVLTIGSTECSRFSINPIEISRVIDLGTTDVENKKRKKRFTRIDCPFEDGPKGSKKFMNETIDNRVSCKKNGCGYRSFAR